MIEPGTPPDEERRVQALESLNIIYTPAEDRFDRITRLARRLFNVPVALVSLVDSTRQWFKSADGIDDTETSRAISFCGHAIMGEDVMVVPDADKDERFSDNPLVKGDPHIRFYAGYPLLGPDGMRLGTLCVIDRKPRGFTSTDMASLRDLGAMVEEELMAVRMSRAQRELITERDALKRRAMVDSLTRLWNRETILELLDRELVHSAHENTTLGVVLADIDHFKAVNDTRGHQAGDIALKEVARRMRGSVRHQDAVGRYGGEEFLIILPSTGHNGVKDMAERMRLAVAEGEIDLPGSNIEMDVPGGGMRITISAGVALGDRGQPKAQALVAGADEALYTAKREGRNCIRIAKNTGTGGRR